jgi:hypothetical protein
VVEGTEAVVVGSVVVVVVSLETERVVVLELELAEVVGSAVVVG